MKNTSNPRSVCATHPWEWSLLLPAIALLAVNSAHAYDPTTDLGRVSGLTELQQRSGDAVQRVCGAFRGGEAIDQTRGDVAQQTELFDKCGEMVHTARVLNGSETGEAGFTNKDLAINEQQLGAALQNVTAEEVAAAGSLATESVAGQSNIIGRRLAGILSRASTLQISSANIQSGNTQALAYLPLESKFADTGGGAAADDELLSSPFGFYVNGLAAFTEKTGTDREDGFESDSTGISFGFDYLFTDSFLGGLNIGHSSSSTNFDITQGVSGGDMDSDQLNISAYGMWFSDAGYLDIVAGYGSGSYDFTRRVLITSGANADAENDGADDNLSADTNSGAFRFSIGGGTEIYSGALSFAPYTRLSYVKVDLDGYEERGESALKLRVDSQSIDSLTGGFGFRLVGTYSGTRAVISPQFNLEMIHEFLDDSREIVSHYIHDPNDLSLIVVTDRPDRTYYTMGVGITALLQNGVQLFAEVRSVMDLDNLSEFSTTGGVRFAF